MTNSDAVPDRGHIHTELANPASRQLDELDIPAAVALMHAVDQQAWQAVGAAQTEIAQAVRLVAAAFQTGGRLVYFGAGTSGRLGVLDASECPPTFCSDPGMVVGVIAGGDIALRRSLENVEDDEDAGAAAVALLQIKAPDVAMGITAGGTTPYVHAALRTAHEQGCTTILLACTAREHITATADLYICLNTGPELLTGSTRLKAGTATKLVLNMLTTLAMAQIGKVHGNLMVDIDAMKNAKLIDRGTRMIQQLSGLPRDTAMHLLYAAGGKVKRALVMHHQQCDGVKADQLLTQHAGRLRPLLNPPT